MILEHILLSREAVALLVALHRMDLIAMWWYLLLEMDVGGRQHHAQPQAE